MLRPRSSNPIAGAVLALLVPCLFVGSWCYCTWGGHGVMPARAVLWVLGSGALALAAAALAARPLPSWSWRSPLPWFAAAVAWQAVALVGWSPLPDPGGIIVAERFAGLAVALAVAAWTPSWWALALWAAAVMGGDLLSLHLPGIQALCGPAAPFGNQNFNAAAAPLAILGLGLAWPAVRGGARAGLGIWLGAVIGMVAIACAVGMALPQPWGRGTRAIVLGLGAGIATLSVLSLPLPRRVASALIAAGLAVVLAAQAACIAGFIPVDSGGPSWEQRLWLWRGSLRAIADSPLIGTGPGGSIEVLHRVPEACGQWLAVPGVIYHSHNEWLQVLLDGGLINACLVVAGLTLTLLPLWRRRRSPAARALLAAWAAVLVHALVESHLSQPGVVWCAALLAGATWGWTRRAAAPAAVTVNFPAQVAAVGIGVAAAGLMAWMAVRDFGPGGTPPMIWKRYVTQAINSEAKAASLGDSQLSAGYWLGAAEALAVVQARIGPVVDLPWREARYRLLASKHLDPVHAAAELAEAERLVALQLQWLPVSSGGLVQARLLLEERRRAGRPAGDLAGLLAEAESRARAWLERTHDNGKNNAHRQALVAVLAPGNP